MAYARDVKVCMYCLHLRGAYVTVTPIHGINYATGGLVPGWNVYVKPHLPQYWRSWWKDIYRVVGSNSCFLLEGNCTYKDASPAGRALATKTLDLAIRLHLVILEDGHLDLLALMLYLFGGLYTNTGWYIKESPDRGMKHAL